MIDPSSPHWPVNEECAIWHRARIRQLAEQRRGVVIAADVEQIPGLYVAVRSLRETGSTLPVQVWHLRPIPPLYRAMFENLGVEWSEANGAAGGWQCKSFAVQHTHFEEILLLDADNCVLADPAGLFDFPMLLWFASSELIPDRQWRMFGVDGQPSQPLAETGQVLVSKRLRGRTVWLANWLNERSDWVYRHSYGDTFTWQVAARATGQDYAMLGPAETVGRSLLYNGPDGRPLFVHRVGEKFLLGRPNPFNAALPGEAQRHQWLAEFDRLTTLQTHPLFSEDRVHER